VSDRWWWRRPGVAGNSKREFIFVHNASSSSGWYIRQPPTPSKSRAGPIEVDSGRERLDATGVMLVFEALLRLRERRFVGEGGEELKFNFTEEERLGPAVDEKNRCR
jgi:hypothetical protein